ncbi:helix-turn-helix transcriptional regulator [Lutimonas saemankumensis]|uniref:helix-turn-helix domain-containing protein n=1 Tax=Lutimonas saemankumensis TaxID=483016 RepID=UPI001CD45006|nr:response regulator transcription factor [Lutimonas saemankumensis]MCA0931308.1 helix-turn-helix transcriptional regulator [Lutimonas saemankumensis]
MKDAVFHIKSISHLHELIGFDKPTHPLISVVDVSQLETKEEQIGLRLTSSLYAIGLKDKSCGLQYGRNSYDFDEGVMYFTGPNQLMEVGSAQKKNQIKGWVINFHPDLIRNTPLGKTIDNYSFFSYDVHEALHLSDVEQQTITDCVGIIKNEITERIDNHSQLVISSSLELLLNLSQRFYERQFNTRAAKNSDILSQFQALLKKYYQEGKFAEQGIPSIEYFADQVFLSPNYFSDLLKKETGQSAKDQINMFIIEKAKTRLLSESNSVSEIAYDLGFNYPHYFSRLFKSKTGQTPLEFRKMN